jgi:hypothetical protein
LISTVTIISQEIIITRTGLAIISSREVSRAANSNGNIMPKTGRGSPTGIMPQLRSTTGGPQEKLQSLGRHFADALIRAGRISAKAEQISPVGVLIVRNRPLPVETLSRAAEHSAAWTAAVVQKTSAAGGNRAVKACPAAVAVVGSVVVPVAVVEDSVVVPVVAAVAADAAAVAVEGDNHVNISINHNETGEGGRNVVHGNAH